MRLGNQKKSSNFVDRTPEGSQYYRDITGRRVLANPGDQYMMDNYSWEEDDGYPMYTDEEVKLMKNGTDVRTILFLRALNSAGRNTIRK